MRRKSNNIRVIQDDNGRDVDWNTGLQGLMVGYFDSLFKASDTEWDDVVRCNDRTITEEQNYMLLRPIEDQKVKNALFHMHPDKSPGPDGMTLDFTKNIGILWVEMSLIWSRIILHQECSRSTLQTQTLCWFLRNIALNI